MFLDGPEVKFPENVLFSSSFLVKLQDSSLHVYQKMNPSQLFFRGFDREIQNSDFLEHLPTATNVCKHISVYDIKRFTIV